MMYHPIKFGCKKISSSADIVETVIIAGGPGPASGHLVKCALTDNPELEDSKPILLHDTLAHNVASPSLVTEGSAAEEISSR